MLIYFGVSLVKPVVKSTMICGCETPIPTPWLPTVPQLIGSMDE